MKKHVFIFYGRFQPPSSGHHMGAQLTIKHANSVDADHFIVGSHSESSNDNPLSRKLKKEHMKKVLGTNNVIVDSNIRGLSDVLQHFHNLGYEKISLMAGEDRIPGYEKMRHYFGKKNVNIKTGKILDLSNIKPENYQVISTGERDPDSEGISGVSGTKMREAAVKGNIDLFHSMVPQHIDRSYAEKMMNDVRRGIENSNIREESNSIITSFLNEYVSPTTRQKLARIAKRTAKKRAMINRIRKRKRKSPEQLKIRAKNEVKSELRKRVFKGNWKKLSYAQRASIDRTIGKRKPLVNSMIRKIMPEVLRGESERLRKVNNPKQNINSSFDPILNNFFANFITEAKTPKRATPTTEQKQRRREQNKNNQRSHRTKESQEIKSGNVAGKVMVVKNRNTGDTEIISKDSFNSKTHTEILGSERATLPAIEKYTKAKEFINTKTSVSLFGLIKDAGKSKTKGETPVSGKAEAPKKKKTKEKTKKIKTKETSKEEQLPLPNMAIDPNWSMPKAANQRGFKASDLEAAITTNLSLMLNNEKPEDLIKKGLITPEEYQLILNNPNLQQATLRAIKSTGLDRLDPKRYSFLPTGRMKQQISESFAGMGTTDQTLKSDVFIYDNKEPENSRGISVKYGASQLGSPKEKEATAVVRTAYERAKERMSPKCQNVASKFIDKTLKQMSEGIKTPGTFSALKKDIGGYGTSNPKLKEAADLAMKRNKDIQEGFNKLVDDCPELKKEIIRELATGSGKFEGTYSDYIEKMTGKKVNAGVANEMLSINEDGTSASLNVMDDDFFDKVMPHVKFYFAMKTTDCGDSGTLKLYDKEFKPGLIDAAKRGSRKDFEKMVKFAQKQFKLQGAVAPSFSTKDIDELLKTTAKNESVPNVLKFKTHCSKSAFRAGKPGEKEEVEENIVFRFIKNFIIEANNTETTIIQSHKGQLKDEDLEPLENPDPEDSNPDAWLDYSREVINNDPFNFLNFMGLDFQSISMNPLDFSELFARLNSSRSNVVYVNGVAHDVPVIDSQVNEDFLIEKRNYRKEYDNYHSRPEQRKNRSKRVLARRLMMKLGRVKKGDGKDVDHKDGNPRNNGKHNLRVRSKSENRADND